MLKVKRDVSKFKWQDLGNLEIGRPNMGLFLPVQIYRLLQYTLRDVLIDELGADKAKEIFVRAGRISGTEFCKNLLNRELIFSDFMAQLQQLLKERSIGILQVEEADFEKMKFVLTVAEDLDCSGLPFNDEIVCQYDEGFISGIMEAYTGKAFQTREIDCWAKGERLCRFQVQSDQSHIG